MQSNIKIIIVRNPMAYATDSAECEILQGDDLFELVTSVYPKGQPLNTHWYHDAWNTENEVTPTSAADIVALNEQGGTFYIATYPAGPAVWIPILVSAFITVAAVLLMPMPTIPNNAANTPPSPNNALAQRTNRQRVGGRVAEIFGEVWAVPDLGAVTYTVYIDGRQVEMSYMTIGRGWYLVTKAMDDTTPINQVFGSSVLIFNSDATLDDTPSYQFGSAFSAEEAALSRLSVKRYTSVNGQILTAPDEYIRASTVFKNPNIIEASGSNDFRDTFKVGDLVLIEGADNLASANGVTTGVEPDVTPVTYTLNGQYEVLEVTAKQIKISSPATMNTDWQALTDNVDFTAVTDSVALSKESDALWQGWFYTNSKEHDSAYINVVSQALYRMGKNGDWVGIRLYGQIESEIVDSNNNPISGTLHTQDFTISAAGADKYGWQAEQGLYDENTRFTRDDKVRRSAGKTVKIENPMFFIGKRLRFRVARKSKTVPSDVGSVADEIRIADFYGARLMTAADAPKGFTKVYSKTLGTEGALSLKERKLFTLSQRLVRDWQNNDVLIPSKRIDDIIYHIGTDSVTSNLNIDDFDMPQIKAEVDAQIAYFGTDLCAQFSGTFDMPMTTEEMIQTVAMTGFFIAYRINNKIRLHFEREEPFSVATFNSHSITPDSFEYSESFGPRNNYDGVEVSYTDPVDDAKVSLYYPADQSAINPDTKDKELFGVRNKEQAHMHLMRRHWKNQLVYSTCSITAADESGIVVVNNRIDIANQTRADTQQGSVESLNVNELGQVILSLSSPVDFGAKTQGTIFVQTASATVDNIRCMPGDNQYEVILNRPPNQPISTAWDAVVRATYNLVLHDDVDRDSYIVTAKEPGNNPLSHRLTCINYDAGYYQNDADFKKGLIA
ncbi:host specificity factor TipJ family phage tail protein [Psychrobacter sp. 16-MNA-CIBAN-0192]|uniref:host specificity factor TipJ family phage tail protein n=1 Tax=Psychrobacter sp. 16-MNA-CIBAN-0192 TaxID=3140448 RepID=UPI003320A51C